MTITVHKTKAIAEIVIEGTDLAQMEAAARAEFVTGFGDTPWELTKINARLDMILIGPLDDHNSWVPGMWRATYEAKEL